MHGNGQSVSDVLDAFLREHLDLEWRANREATDDAELAALGREIFESSHEYADRLLQRVGPPSAGGWRRAATILQQHDLHRRILLQSSFIDHAYRKPHGYAGDKDLMLIIYDNADRGETPYAALKNRVYQTLPAAEAVRRRILSIERCIDELPSGSKVLSLACGPAREVQRHLVRQAKGHSFDLIDHDTATIEYTSASIHDGRIRHVVGNAFDIVRGQKEYVAYAHERGVLNKSSFDLRDGEYDLVYSAGLFDYIKDSSANPGRRVRALTSKLFLLLKPGGRALIGNFLIQAEGNTHLMHHRLMMELYSEWNLLYRTKTEIFDFAGALPAGQAAVTFYNEFLDRPDPKTGVIGFIEIRRLG